jgi:hypothetical protein
LQDQRWRSGEANMDDTTTADDPTTADATAADATTADATTADATTADATTADATTADASTTSSDTGAAVYNTDMDTIGQYVAAVVEAKSKISTSFLAAIDNFGTVAAAASPADAKTNILGAVMKSGLKSVEKTAVTAVKSATGADLGPLVDVVNAVSDEIDRAAAAAQNLAVAQWITSTRAAVANAYTQDQSGVALHDKIVQEYNQNDAGGRGGYIGGIQNELAALKTVQTPVEEVVEVAMYEEWINQHFNNDCIDGTGIIYLQFGDDGSFTSASVVAPIGDKIAGALNSQMSNAGVANLMALEVVKKVCKGPDCMCFEVNNVIRKAASDDQNQAYLSADSTWKLAELFS